MGAAPVTPPVYIAMVTSWVKGESMGLVPVDVICLEYSAIPISPDAQHDNHSTPTKCSLFHLAFPGLVWVIAA